METKKGMGKKTERPSYINPNIKKVSEVDLKAVLKEVNRKNKEFRDSFRDPRHDNICY